MKVNIIGNINSDLKKSIRQVVSKTVLFLNQPKNVEMTVKCVDENEIQALNKKTRQIDRITDVLSYPFTNVKAGEILSDDYLLDSSFDGKNIYLGDCALCLTVAKEQSKIYGVSLQEEIEKLICHSVLHLLGYDHILRKDFKLMNKKEMQILGDY